MNKEKLETKKCHGCVKANAIGDYIYCDNCRKKARGFNSVLSCPNCNFPNVKQLSEISRHEFMNPYEFTDKALLKELIIRIQKGCIEIKNKENNIFFEEECKWDLARGLKKNEKGEIVEDENAERNYTVFLKDLISIQEKQQELENQDKICDICLEREKSSEAGIPSIFCFPCWEREKKVMY